MRRLLLKLLALLIPVVGFVFARHPAPELPGVDERSATTMFDPEIGWVPRPNYHAPYTGSRTFDVMQNSLGLREHELGPKTRKRVLVVGDSHAWGYDSDQDKRFSDLLATAHPDIEFVNAGVSGYGTDQELLFTRRLFDRVKPDAVVLIFAELDNDDNSSDMRYGYNKPYFIDNGTSVTLAGVPVARPLSFYATEFPRLFAPLPVRWTAAVFVDEFRRPPVFVPTPTRAIFTEMKRYLGERGVTLGVAVQSPDSTVQGFLTRLQIPWIDALAPIGAASHWTPEGHQLVATRLEPLLAQLLR